MNTNTKIYVANLGKYNEGWLVGEWVGLPITEEELEELYVRIKVAHYNEDGDFVPYYEEDGIIYEETAIHDYETDLTGLEIGEWDSIGDLSDLVEKCEELHEWEYKKLEAILETESCGLEQAIEEIDSYNLIEGVDNDDDLGLYYYEVGCIDIPEHLINYFDFEAYGRDISFSGTYTSNGFLKRY